MLEWTGVAAAAASGRERENEAGRKDRELDGQVGIVQDVLFVGGHWWAVPKTNKRVIRCV